MYEVGERLGRLTYRSTVGRRTRCAHRHLPRRLRRHLANRAVPSRSSVPAASRLSFINASGQPNKHHGNNIISLEAAGSNKIIAMLFQICDDIKPLAAVRKMREKGNLVQFGPGLCESFLDNKKTGEKRWSNKMADSMLRQQTWLRIQLFEAWLWAELIISI